jgi:hypothetical protein
LGNLYALGWFIQSDTSMSVDMAFMVLFDDSWCILGNLYALGW